LQSRHTLAEAACSAVIGRGTALERRRDTEGALKEYDQAVALRPDFRFAFSTRGALLPQTGQFERAMADYNRAVALNPNSHEAFFGRGNVFRRMGDLAFSAKGDLDRAIADYDLGPEAAGRRRDMGVRADQRHR
jgi:Flp pilus assembly protein TadD